MTLESCVTLCVFVFVLLCIWVQGEFLPRDDKDESKLRGSERRNMVAAVSGASASVFHCTLYSLSYCVYPSG